jgi:hypothetical protein
MLGEATMNTPDQPASKSKLSTIIAPPCVNVASGRVAQDVLTWRRLPRDQRRSSTSAAPQQHLSLPSVRMLLCPARLSFFPFPPLTRFSFSIILMSIEDTSYAP